MRVSERQRYNVTSDRVENAKNNNALMLEEMSTQKTINHLSDNPINAAQVVKEQKRLAQQQQISKSIDYAKGYLESSELAVSGISNALIRAKELSVAMANQSYGPASRSATAREIKEIMSSVVSMGNSTYGNRYVFGGFRSQTPPVSDDGLFLGDDGEIFIQVGEQDYKQMNLQSRSLFEANDGERAKGHFNLIHTLNVLYTGLMDDDIPQIRVAMEELDFQLDKVTNFHSKIGALYNSLESISSQLGAAQDSTTGNISKLQDADMYRTASDFKRTESVLQSTLMASTKLLQPSLLNFLQ